MDKLSVELYENSKLILKEASQKFFLLKIILLFGIYLISNYIFDRIDHEDLLRTFHNKPYISIKFPNNTTFKIIITLLMIIFSHYIYRYLLKPIVYPID
jgi:hypothetical protein